MANFPLSALPVMLNKLKFSLSSSLCAKVRPSMIQFMKAQADLMRYLVNEDDGMPGPDFCADLATMECEDVVPVAQACPELGLFLTVTAGDGRCDLLVSSGTGALDSSYQYTISRDSVQIYPAAGTQAVSGSSIAYADTPLTNGVTYAYSVVVSKTGCDDETVTGSGTPAAVVVPVDIADVTAEVFWSACGPRKLGVRPDGTDIMEWAGAPILCAMSETSIPGWSRTLVARGGGIPELAVTSGYTQSTISINIGTRGLTKLSRVVKLQACEYDVVGKIPIGSWTDIKTVEFYALPSTASEYRSSWAARARAGVSTVSYYREGLMPGGCSTLNGSPPPVTSVWYKTWRAAYNCQLPVVREYQIAASDLPAGFAHNGRTIKNIAFRALGVFDDGSVPAGAAWSNPSVLAIDSGVI